MRSVPKLGHCRPMRDARARSGGFGESYRVQPCTCLSRSVASRAHLPLERRAAPANWFLLQIAPLPRFTADWPRIVKTRERLGGASFVG
jgi:hypothetical protein